MRTRCVRRRPAWGPFERDRVPPARPASRCPCPGRHAGRPAAPPARPVEIRFVLYFQHHNCSPVTRFSTKKDVSHFAINLLVGKTIYLPKRLVLRRQLNRAGETEPLRQHLWAQCNLMMCPSAGVSAAQQASWSASPHCCSADLSCLPGGAAFTAGVRACWRPCVADLSSAGHVCPLYTVVFMLSASRSMLNVIFNGSDGTRTARGQ